ncbi:MAG: helix-turn-helix domain-containing protein [Spirochaetota bacterium]
MTQEQLKRLNGIIDAAFRVFHLRGYKLAQMNDVARELSVSVGSLYGMVKGKKALFDLCLMESFVDNYPDTSLPLPVEEIDHGRLLDEIIGPKVTGIVDGLAEYCETMPPLEELVGVLFDSVDSRWRGIRLENCAVEWPILDDFYYTFRKRTYDIVTDYMEKAVTAGLVRPLRNIPMSARLLIENISYYAMHRRYDLFLHDMDISEARELTIDAMVHAFEYREEHR